MSLGLDSNLFSHVVSYSREFFLEILTVSPLIHLGKHEAFSIFKSILTINTTLELIGISYGAVLEIKHPDSSRETLRWLDVISEVDVGISLLEIIDILNSVVVMLHIVISQEIIDRFIALCPFIEESWMADCNIYCNLGVIINLVSAPLNSRNKVDVVYHATVHANNIALIPVDMRKNKWNGS